MKKHKIFLMLTSREECSPRLSLLSHTLTTIKSILQLLDLDFHLLALSQPPSTSLATPLAFHISSSLLMSFDKPLSSIPFNVPWKLWKTLSSSFQVPKPLSTSTVWEKFKANGSLSSLPFKLNHPTLYCIFFPFVLLHSKSNSFLFTHIFDLIS